jgi:hypothetical protein
VSTAAFLAFAAALPRRGPVPPERPPGRIVEAPPRGPVVDDSPGQPPPRAAAPVAVVRTGPTAPPPDPADRPANARRVEASVSAPPPASLPSDVWAHAAPAGAGPEAESAAPHAPAVARGPVREASERRPRTATIEVLMPTEKAELVIRGEVGKGNPDEWYGPRRVVHTPPLREGADYLVGAFFLGDDGRPLTRSRPIRIEPGKSYEVDLRPARPTSREIDGPHPSDRPQSGSTP